ASWPRSTCCWTTRPSWPGWPRPPTCTGTAPPPDAASRSWPPGSASARLGDQAEHLGRDHVLVEPDAVDRPGERRLAPGGGTLPAPGAQAESVHVRHHLSTLNQASLAV